MEDAALKALLAADLPPAQDPYFVLAVMARIEQRRFRRELAVAAALAAAAIGLLALVMPKIDMKWTARLSPINDIALAVTLMMVTIIVPRLFAGRND